MWDWLSQPATLGTGALVTFIAGLLYHFARVSRENLKLERERAEAARVAREQTEAEQRRIVEENQRRAAEEARAAAAVVAAKRTDFRASLDAAINSLDGHRDARQVYAERKMNVTYTADQFAATLTGQTRTDFDEAWNQYRELEGHIPKFGLIRLHTGSQILDHSQGIAVLLPALQRLRSFVE